MDYSSANACGGKVLADAVAMLGRDCKIIQVTEYGF